MSVKERSKKFQLAYVTTFFSNLKLERSGLWMTIPELYEGPTPLAVREAYASIQAAYRHAFDLLRSEAPDGMRLKVNADKLELQSMPLVDELRRMSEVPRQWIASVASAVRVLEQDLRKAAEQMHGIGRERDR